MPSTKTAAETPDPHEKMTFGPNMMPASTKASQDGLLVSMTALQNLSLETLKIP
jgi:hypothetical protein